MGVGASEPVLPILLINREFGFPCQCSAASFPMLVTERKPELFRELDEFIDLAARKTRKSL